MSMCLGLELLPFLKINKPFAAWIATTHFDERISLKKTKLRHYILYNSLTDYFTKKQEILVGKRNAREKKGASDWLTLAPFVYMRFN